MSTKLDDIIKKLKNYGCSMTNDNGPFIATQNATYSENYTAQSIKRAHLTNCLLQNAAFDDAAVTGSSFFECTFINCSMDRADFEFCNFESCEFFDTPFSNESYNNSTFYNTKFINSPFSSCTLTGVLFKVVLFSNAGLEHCTLEGAVFEDCTFQNLDLSNLNMEFIELKNIHMDNVILPFSQMPYIFGGIEYITETDDDIRLGTDKGTTIDRDEYLSNAIPLLCEYFEKKEDHFPLANIYLALGYKAKAYKHLKLGMQYCVVSKDFRMLKYFCKLAARNNGFTYKELNTLYTSIQKFMPQDTLNQQQLHNYSKHIGEIKTILFSKHDTPKVTFSIRTNIEPDGMHPLSNLIEDIFAIKQQICNNSNAVQLILEQNSPFIVTLNITGELFNLCCFVLIVIKLINESQDIYSSFWNYICTFKDKREEYITNTLIPLLELVENKQSEYRASNTYFSADEIWFSNVESHSNFKLQYFKTNKLAITERLK